MDKGILMYPATWHLLMFMIHKRIPAAKKTCEHSVRFNSRASKGGNKYFNTLIAERISGTSKPQTRLQLIVFALSYLLCV